MEWIHFPRIRTFVEKRFHGLFSKKKRSKSGGVPSFKSFPRREHSSGSNFPPDWAANSSRSISRHYFMTSKFSRITARETCSRAVISLQKNLSRKISPEKSLDFLSRKSVLRPALVNEYVAFFALLSSGHGPLLGYSNLYWSKKSTKNKIVNRSWAKQT